MPDGSKSSTELKKKTAIKLNIMIITALFVYFSVLFDLQFCNVTDREMRCGNIYAVSYQTFKCNIDAI